MKNANDTGTIAKGAHSDRKKNAKDWEWFISFYEFVPVKILGTGETLADDDYWYNLRKDMYGEPYGLLLAEPCKGANIWPRHSKLFCTEFDKQNKEFKEDINKWFILMINCEKIRRRDKKEIKRKTNNYKQIDDYF